MRDPQTGATVARTHTVNANVRHALAMCDRYLRATRHWVIYVQNHFTWEWEAYRPTIEGKPRIFATKGQALDYAYDYGVAGHRNAFVDYREEPLPESQGG